MRIFYPPAGGVIYIWFLGVFRHKGIVSDRVWKGKPTVITNSWEKGVHELCWDDFVAGQPWFLEPKPSSLSCYEAVYRARLLIGRPYHVLSFNCEHFVAACYGLRPASPQIVGVVLAVSVGFLLAVQS
jgi:hypothetical protein